MIHPRDYQQQALSALADTDTRRPLVSMPTGCLAADTVISINRAGKGFSLPIKRLVQRFNGRGRGILLGPQWNPTIPTRVQRAEDGVVLLAVLSDAWRSGRKETFELTTASGRNIRATTMHPFLTREGWATLGELKIGDELQVIGTQAGNGKGPKLTYKIVAGMWCHPYASRFISRRRDRADEHLARVPYHRLVAEARLNKLSVERFIARIRRGDVKHLVFLDPEITHVHHVDGNHRNNKLGNLEVLTPQEHLTEHGIVNVRNVLYKVTYERVRSIKHYGEEPTYDLSVADDPHNFLANGFVVHNTGKTPLAAWWLQSLNANRVVLLAHRDELVQQAVEKLQLVNGGQVGIIKAERNEVDAPTIVASVQTLVQPKRFAQLMKAGAPQAVVCDEAHHYRSESWHAVLQQFGCFEEYGPLTLGITATPERSDGKALGKVFEKIVYRLSLLDAIRKGYLCNLRALSLRLDCDFRQLRTSHGEIRDDEAGEMLLRAMAPERIAEAIQLHAAGRKTLVFTPTVEVSKAVTHECRELGMAAMHLDGTTPIDERRAILQRFATGETSVLSNCAVLTEGYDEPSVSCVVMARPTKSRVFYQQAIGRGTRLFPDKEDCLILDVVGATHRHDLMNLDELLTEDVEPGDAVAEHEPGADYDDGPPPEDGKLVAEVVDLFASRPFAWVKSDFGYILSLGKENGWVLLMETTKGWAVDRLERDSDRSVRAELGVIPQLGYAQGMAEDYVRKLGVEALAKRDARWRNAPMTDSQRWMLERWRLPWHGSYTKGRASDELTRAIVGANLRTLMKEQA